MCEDRGRSGAFCRVCGDLCGLLRSAEHMSADTQEDGDEVSWLLGMTGGITAIAAFSEVRVKWSRCYSGKSKAFGDTLTWALDV